MKRPFAPFDIETAKVLPEDVEDIREHRPLGVSCAVLVVGDSVPLRFFNPDDLAWTQEHAQMFLTTLEQHIEDGIRVASWNGLGFDLDILAEEAGEGEWREKARKIALNHYDLMFQVMCTKGYPVSLQNSCKGFGLEGKLASVGGAKAPAMWAEGHRQEVLDYCAQDVKATLEVFESVEYASEFRWISKKGRPNSFDCPELLTVSQCLELPEPNTSWMDNPIPRTAFTHWLYEDVERPMQQPVTKPADPTPTGFGELDFIQPRQ